jgi:transcriptional regulator with XRE-family HTH domain
VNLAERVAAARLPAGPIRRSIRVAAGVTLREMADELGVTPMTVLRWEQGIEPHRDRAIRYRELLDALRELSR